MIPWSYVPQRPLGAFPSRLHVLASRMLKKSASGILNTREAYLVGGGADSSWRIARTKTILYLFYGHAIDHKPYAICSFLQTRDERRS